MTVNKSFSILSQPRLQQLLHRLAGIQEEHHLNHWQDQARTVRRTPPSGPDLLARLRRLPRRTRQVFLLRRLDGLSYAAIADQLGLPLDLVEKDMIRALDHCQRACLGE